MTRDRQIRALAAEIARLGDKVAAIEAKRARADILAFERPMHRVLRFISGQTDVPIAQLIGARGDVPTVSARFAACWSMRIGVGATYRQIGDMMGRRDTTTIGNAVRVAGYLRERDPAFLALTNACLTFLKETHSCPA